LSVICSIISFACYSAHENIRMFSVDFLDYLFIFELSVLITTIISKWHTNFVIVDEQVLSSVCSFMIVRR